LDAPEGLAFDQAGNLYFPSGDFSHPTTGVITKITPQGVASRFAFLGQGYRGGHQNFGVTFDGQGNLFVADNLAEAIYAITPARRVSTFVSFSFPKLPIGLAFDGAGNLYASDTDPYDLQGSITKIAPDGTQTLVVSGLGGLSGLAFDPNGNLFVAGHGNNVIYKITPDGSVSVFATGLDVPQFLAVEP
jgi:sugar lactone lactonase YvrE